MSHEKTEQEILQTISKIVEDHATLIGISPATVDTTTSFKEMNFDSIDQIEIVMQLEEAFSVAITDEDAEQITSIEHATEIIQSLLTQSPSSL